MGTIVYAAPECLDRPQDADPRADVYGLGMTAIFGLHGADLPLQILRGPEPFLEQLPCAEGLKAVLHRATSMVPGDRYEDAGEFITALSASGE
jgi:serine/threonine-protein kinase